MWWVEICHFLYLRPVAYITACTTVQAVMGAGVRLSVCRVPPPNSRTERRRKPEIGMMEAHRTSNFSTYLRSEGRGQRSRSPGRLMRLGEGVGVKGFRNGRLMLSQ